jgi:UDP:flavonoid glycosyltransferase YjiC (YdhE family)
MKIGFVCCSPVQGHFNPMSTLARQLQLRNHEVVMLSTPATEPLVRAANLPSVSFAAKEIPVEKMSEMVAFLGRLKGTEALQYTVGAIAAKMEVQWRQFPDLLDSTGWMLSSSMITISTVSVWCHPLRISRQLRSTAKPCNSSIWVAWSGLGS